MTFAPRTLLDLRDYWRLQGGAFLGIVGDTRHTWGYHLGRNRIYTIPPGRGDRDPSVQHPRDRAGLTNAAAAIDLGRLGGSVPRLTAFADWLAERCRAGAPGTSDIAEIIWPRPSGVWYYSESLGRSVHRLPDDSTAARTHRGHAHIGYRRDSEARDKVAVLAPFFTPREVTMYERRNVIGRFTIAANTAPRAWRPRADGTGWEVARTWTRQATASSAAFDHQLVRIAGTMKPASLLGASSGSFAGLYVSTAEVTHAVTPLPDLSALLADRTRERDAARNRLAEVRAEVRSHFESAQAAWGRIKAGGTP